MQLDTDEFGALADMLSAQKIAALKQQISVAHEETAYWRRRCEMVETLSVASEMENIYLKNYIMLSLEKIKKFVSRLNDLDRWAFLRTFVFLSVPKELEVAERDRIEEAMAMPEERRPDSTVTNNYYEPGSNCQVFNDKVTGQFEKKENDGRE